MTVKKLKVTKRSAELFHTSGCRFDWSETFVRTYRWSNRLFDVPIPLHKVWDQQRVLCTVLYTETKFSEVLQTVNHSDLEGWHALRYFLFSQLLIQKSSYYTVPDKSTFPKAVPVLSLSDTQFVVKLKSFFNFSKIR